MNLVELVSQSLTYLTVFAQVIIVVLLISKFLPKEIKKGLLEFVTKNAIKLSLIVALAGTLGSLFYSEIAGYEPCKLCWYQRIFMYPLPFLFGVSLWKKDLGVIKYAVALSIVGGTIALYHYLMQTGVLPGACGVVGYSVSCSQRFVMEMGYITIPMMSLSAFGLIIALLLVGNKKLKK